jgi:hypothetical protein
MNDMSASTVQTAAHLTQRDRMNDADRINRLASLQGRANGADAVLAGRDILTHAMFPGNWGGAESFVAAQGPNWGPHRAAVEKQLDLRMKGVVGAVDTGSVPARSLPAFAELALVRLSAAIGRINATRVPFAARVFLTSTAPGAAVVEEGEPIPATQAGWTTVEVAKKSVASLQVISMELARANTATTAATIASLVTSAIGKAADEEFLTLAASPEVAAGGITIPLVDSALATALVTLQAAGSDLSRVIAVVPAVLAIRLGLLRGTAGVAAYDIDLVSGTGRMGSIPVLVTSAGSAGLATTIVLLDAARVLMADESSEGVEIDAAQSATLQMLTDPTNASTDGTATTMTSMFQCDAVAIRGVWHTGWFCPPSAAVRITGVA